MRRRPTPLLGIFLTVFIDLLSFGLVIPDIQLRGDHLGAQGVLRGLLIATFSVFQLLAAPFLGRLSDRVGRRPVLLVTTMLAALSFVFYAHADTLWVMFASRMLAGVAGANIGVAFAYISDVTRPEERAKGMGLIGAAFGLGFILGPPVGAFLLQMGSASLSGAQEAALSGALAPLPLVGRDLAHMIGLAAAPSPLILGYTAALVGLVNFLYVLFVLPESLARPREEVRRHPLRDLGLAFRTPELATLLLLFFAANFAFSNLESTYFLLTNKAFRLSQLDGAMILGFVGVVSAIMQGGVVRIVTPKYGEVNLVRAGFLMQVPALLLIPVAPPWIPQLAVVLFLGIGGGLVQPSMGSLISRNAPRDLQGSIFGVTQALGAMARILGPICGNDLFDVHYWLPYALAGLVMLLPALLAWRLRMPEDSAIAAPAH